MQSAGLRGLVVVPLLCSLAFGALIHSIPHSHGPVSQYELADEYVLPPDLRGEAIAHVHPEPADEPGDTESVAWRQLHDSLVHENKKDVSMGQGTLSFEARIIVSPSRSPISQASWFLRPDRWTDPDADSFVTDGRSQDRRFS